MRARSSSIVACGSVESSIARITMSTSTSASGNVEYCAATLRTLCSMIKDRGRFSSSAQERATICASTAAARALREVFADEEIFRAGGDEFTVIVLGATPEDMAAKARLVDQRAAREGAVSFALGFHVEADCQDVRAALRRADENMYENKRQYYQAHPGLARG